MSQERREDAYLYLFLRSSVSCDRGSCPVFLVVSLSPSVPVIPALCVLCPVPMRMELQSWIRTPFCEVLVMGGGPVVGLGCPCWPSEELVHPATQFLGFLVRSGNCSVMGSGPLVGLSKQIVRSP
ncbi:unnamed protein product [Eretmochelys imbricata]